MGNLSPRPTRLTMRSFPALLVFLALVPATVAAGTLSSVETLNPPSGTSHLMFFGESVAVDGDYMLIGDSGDASGGAVHVYEREAGIWAHQTTLTGEASGVTPADFGELVALHGTTAVVSDPTATTPSGTGAIYVYERVIVNLLGESPESQGLPVWLRTRRIDSTSPESIGGAGLAVDSDALAFGDTRQGHVFVHERDLGGTGNWGLADQLSIPHAGGSPTRFGIDVALLGDVLLVGAISHAHEGVVDSGGAFVFRRSATGVWMEEAELQLDPPVQNRELGLPVDLTLDDTTGFPFLVLRAVVGAFTGDPVLSVDVFGFERPEHVSTWGAAEVVFTIPSPSRFNLALTASSRHVAIADPRSPPSTLEGRAYLVTKREGVWSPLAELVPPSIEGNDLFGWSLEFGTNHLWVSAVNGGPTDSGAVHAFPLPLFLDGFESGDATAWSAVQP